MKEGQIKTIPNSAKKHMAESDTYEAVYLVKNNQADFYLFTEVELTKGWRRAKLQPEEELENPMNLDLSKGIYALIFIAAFILGAIIF